MESEHWKAKSENENENELFFFFLTSSSAYLPGYDKYGLNLGETGQAVQVR